MSWLRALSPNPWILFLWPTTKARYEYVPTCLLVTSKQKKCYLHGISMDIQCAQCIVLDPLLSFPEAQNCHSLMKLNQNLNLWSSDGVCKPTHDWEAPPRINLELGWFQYQAFHLQTKPQQCWAPDSFCLAAPTPACLAKLSTLPQTQDPFLQNGAGLLCLLIGRILQCLRKGKGWKGTPS